MFTAQEQPELCWHAVILVQNQMQIYYFFNYLNSRDISPTFVPNLAILFRLAPLVHKTVKSFQMVHIIIWRSFIDLLK